MKKSATPGVTISIMLLGIASLPAQVFDSSDVTKSGGNKPTDLGFNTKAPFAADRLLSGAHEVPVVTKSAAEPSDAAPVFVSQDALTLGARRSVTHNVESILDLSVLRETSAYRSADRIKIKVSDEEASGIQAGLAQLSAAYQKPGQDSADCGSVSLSVEQRVKMDSSKVLEIIESEISANPNCACEIVKIAIKASGADESLVGDITEVAITAAPESMRMISQCAIAAMPDALASVQAVIARLDPNSGDSSASSKSAKSGKDAKAAIASVLTPPVEPPNPLDLPTPPFLPLPPPPLPPLVTNPNP
ncbi:hypothetical protein HZ994_15050 [Akkermansiaceae bacterium]|nr:hypothetical protein HZ994_15050 [Akkermansiaceae bacterium]